MVHEITEAVSRCDFVDFYDIIEYIEEETVEFIRLKAELSDGTILHIRESFSLGKGKYSYHWQQRDGKLIMRWDNAPHHLDISTFPHHLHDGNNIVPSERVFIDVVLIEISKRIFKQ